jgi:hypothetical protein
MLNWVIVLASATFPSGAIGDFLSKWEQAGFFSYLLPFLLIFALVFGILTRVKIFKDNKVVNGIIALAVALMALQFDFVPTFFSQIFPRVGVALAIILSVMIVVGLFMDPDSKVVNYFLLGIGVITIGAVLIQSAGAVGWQSGGWWQDNWQLVVGAIFLFILVAVIIGSSSPKDRKDIPYVPIWARPDK